MEKILNTEQIAGSGTAWFVGASYGGTEDQMPRFLADGIWENGYEDSSAHRAVLD